MFLQSQAAPFVPQQDPRQQHVIPNGLYYSPINNTTQPLPQQFCSQPMQVNHMFTAYTPQQVQVPHLIPVMQQQPVVAQQLPQQFSAIVPNYGYAQLQSQMAPQLVQNQVPMVSAGIPAQTKVVSKGSLSGGNNTKPTDVRKSAIRRGSTSSCSTASAGTTKESADYSPPEPASSRNVSLSIDGVEDLEMGPNRFPCTHAGCDEVFDWKVRRDAHMRTHIGEEDRKYKCMYCNKGFFTMGCLKSHTRIHTRKADSYVCKAANCSKRYSTAEGLRLHIRNHHVVDKKWVCKVAGCTRSFVRHADLRLHNIRIHSKHRPYPCSVEGCQKAFACFSELKRHLACHSKNKEKQLSKKRAITKVLDSRKRLAVSAADQNDQQSKAANTDSSPSATSTAKVSQFVEKSMPDAGIVKNKPVSLLTVPVSNSSSTQKHPMKAKKEEELLAAQALANLIQ